MSDYLSVEFAPIDARDGVCGYDVAAFCWKGEMIRELGPNNGRQRLLMLREYLTRLSALQCEIEAKYKPLFDPKEPAIKHDDCYDEGFATEADYNRVKKEARKLFPGPEAEHYT